VTASSTTTTERLGAAVEGLGRLLASRRVASRLADAAGTDVGQQGLTVLRSLHRYGRQPIAAVAANAHMDVGAVSRQLRALETADLIRREADPDDARVVHVSLTPAGRGVARRVQTVQRRHLDEATSAWSDDDKDTLASLLARLVADLRDTPVR
jgi:DNA-binding MarR family transcriptional regulator